MAGGTTGGLAGGSHGQAVQRTQRAHVAALRRAADLLAICAEARRKAGGGAGGMAADGTMALCRKLFYMGGSGCGILGAKVPPATRKTCTVAFADQPHCSRPVTRAQSTPPNLVHARTSPQSPSSTLTLSDPVPSSSTTPGAIAGVQHTAGGPSAGSAAVAETVLAALEEAVAGPHGHGQPYGGGVRLLEQRFLAAAAFLARESAEEAEEAASGACHRLLQALCTAPLKRCGVPPALCCLDCLAPCHRRESINHLTCDGFVARRRMGRLLFPTCLLAHE